MEGFKLEGKHSDACRAKDDEDGITFVITDRPARDWNRRRNGHRGGSTLWHRFVCNDPDCTAVALVRWDVLAQFVSRGVSA